MFFLTPILFTLVLLGVLLTLFNVDLRNRFLEAGNKVPFLESILPEAPAAAGEVVTDAAIRETNTSEKIAELEALLAAKDIEVTQLASANTQQEQTIAELQAQLEQLSQIGQEKQLDDEAYQTRITELASMFGQITPSKAAPILQSMTLEEMVLIMDAMRPEIRVAVMEKMAPARAAEATVMLKDTVSAKDRQIAALQARLNEQTPATGQTNPYLDDAQLSGTFNNMAPDSAAALLLQMAEVSPAKTLQILNTVDDTSRSEIIAEMSELNEKYTAQLVAKLMAGR